MRKKRHDWRERTESGENRLWRATKYGGKWAIYSRLQRSEDEFVEHGLDDLHALLQLREVLFNKYQRRRLPWEDVERIDSLIESAGSSTASGGGGE